MLDEKRIIVEKRQTPLIKSLKNGDLSRFPALSKAITRSWAVSIAQHWIFGGAVS